MGHEHDHTHGDENYFLDQLSTVAVCGLIGGIGFLMWKVDLLEKYNILTAQFNRPVLFGSVALGVLVLIRGVTLWSEVGKRKAAASPHQHDHRDDHEHDHGHAHDDHAGHYHAPGEVCDHDHDHDHAHTHDHAHGAHEHGPEEDHGHDHGFAPWRYAVLLLPLMLSGLLLYYYFNGLQLTYSVERLEKMAQGKGPELVEGDTTSSGGKNNTVLQPGLHELTNAASDPVKRDFWQGQTAELRGLLSPGSDREFSLFRLKMTCCASDAVPVKVRIFAPDSLSRFNLQAGKGVDVVGEVQFRQVKGSAEFVPILLARELKQTDLGNEIYDKGQ